MLQFSRYFIFTALFLFFSSTPAQVHFSAQCGNSIQFEYFFKKNSLELRTPTPTYKIPLPAEVLKVLENRNPQGLEESYFETEDDFYKYRFEFLKTDHTENLSFVVSVAYKTEFELQGFSNSIKRFFGSQATSSVERREFFVTLRKTGRPSQMVFRQYIPAKDFSELVKEYELWCDIVL